MTQSENRLFLIQSLLKGRPEYRRVETSRDPEGQRQLLRGLMNVRPPQAADPDFLRVQDAYLQAERYESFLRTRQGQKLLFLELGHFSHRAYEGDFAVACHEGCVLDDFHRGHSLSLAG